MTPAAIIKAAQAAVASGRAGASTGTGGINHGSIQVGSHTLKTVMDVPVSYVMHGDSAFVDFNKQKLVVDFGKGRVLLDDTEQAKLPDGTKDVEVQFVGGKLSITADGTAVSMPAAPSQGTGRE